ncbi:HAD-IC family P-type ATPase [Clostridium intestinale]|uniref:ATPase, P-type (Transporting), HAD superfamily, subfamily IC n=1 Tax=Clostridium intestinale DSM 6191 TaxID=1121320 RepID=A0A1M5XMY9_9CLOT|nr:HAD-IC family P-type ATPase [Clostridium intestinale]SHI00918.1 ATPase, P-type (transporting), HAD superfamily, subfamily IC [Clostridium intestinale DSM 6191]
MKAIKEYFTKSTGRKAKSISGFSSEFKYSGVEFEEESVILGAPEMVLKNIYNEYEDKIEEYSNQGYRVLVFGKYEGIPNGKELTGKVIPYCLIILSNPIRENTPETFKYFYEQGVDIKVISGDNPITVSKIAKQAKIENADDYIDCSRLSDDKAIENAANEYTVFGRVTPEQKRKLIRALKKQGKTVAMTGDGVNDILALKEADCSIAMASGSEAAVQASQLVLLESDFSKMPNIVKEGRRVVNNLERSGSLFLVKNIFSILTAILAISFRMRYPLTPSQISLISMFTIGIPAFLLSQIPNTDIIKGNFAKNIILKALPGGLTDTIIVAIMVTVGIYFDASVSDTSTASTILLAIVGLMVLYNISKPMNNYKFAIWIACTLGLILSMIFFKDLFALTKSMAIQAVLLCINFSIMTEPILRYITKMINWINLLLERHSKERFNN